MIEFILSAAALTAVGLLFVLVPLWRASTPAGDRRREANIEIYHQRCAEIEREVAANRITRGDAEHEKDALGARLLSDIDAAAADTVPAARPAGKPWIASGLIVLLVAGGATAGYWQLGDWQAIRDRAMPDIGTLIGKLKAQIKAHPHDMQARYLLAQAQQNLGDYASAAENLHAINAELPKPQPALIVAEADATLAATNNLQGPAGALYAQALKLDDKNREALWYMGLRAAEAGNKRQAIGYWNRLLQQKLPDDVRNTVKSRRDELAGHKPGLGRSG